MFPDVDIDLPTWRCQICGNGIKWVRDNIFYHLRTHHFTLESYRRIYIDGKEGEAKAAGGGGGAASPAKPLPQLLPIQSSPAAGPSAAHTTGLSSDSPGGGVKEKKFRCKICGLLVTFNTEAIRSHLQNFHNMSLNEYKPIYTTGVTSASLADNVDGGSDVQRRMPKLFQTLSQGSSAMAATAAQLPPPPQLQPLHAVGANSSEHQPAEGGGGGGGGTAWYNRCKWTCMVCNKAFCSGFWRHVQEAHGLAKTTYLEQFGKAGIDIVHYFCRICNRKIPWSGASINGHTKAEHGMSLKEYEQVYGPPPPPPPPMANSAPQALGPPQLSMFHLPTYPMVRQPQQQILPTLLSQPPPPQRNQTVEKWFNGCEYKCQLCARILYSVAGLSLHLRDAHFTDKFAYFRQFGRAGIHIKKYRCKICFKCFPWSGVSISKHVKQAHSMSLQKYSALYENDSGPFERISEPDEELEMASPSKLSGASPIVAPKQVKWFNKCSWTCQICGAVVTTNSSAFYKHVSEHQVPIDEYKEKYGNAGFVYVDHTCKLCKKRVPCNGLAMCKHFKHSHNMQLEEYEARFMKDDDGTSNSESYEPTDELWYNKCIWKCQICGNKNRSMGSSKKHVQKAHNMSYEDYHEQFGTEGITEFDFKCRLCSVVMSCNGVTIASHLLNNHRLTLGEYEKKYLKKSKAAPGSPDIIERVPGSSSSSSGLLHGGHFLLASKEDKHNTEEERQPTEKEANKAWYQKCQYICQLCKNTYFSISALRNHVKVKHNMERDEYVERFGTQAGRIIEDYECKLCHRVLKCEGRSLNAHMRNCHKMGIIEYSRRYESERDGGDGGRFCGGKSGGGGGGKSKGKAKKQQQDDPHYADETYQIEVDNDEEGGEEEEEETDNVAAAHVVSVENDDDDEHNDDDEEGEDDENTVSSFDPLSNVETVEEEDEQVGIEEGEDEEENSDDEDDDDNDIEDIGEDEELMLGDGLIEEEEEEEEEAFTEGLEHGEEEEEEESQDVKPDVSQISASGGRILQQILETTPKGVGISASSNEVHEEEEEEEDMNDMEDIADYSDDVYRVDPNNIADEDDEPNVDDEEAVGPQVNGDSSNTSDQTVYTDKVCKKELLTR
jgi:hypothetical protein